MRKILVETGRNLIPKDFRKLKKCLTCGKAVEITDEGRCYNCWKKNLNNCEICEIILREGDFIFYSYDTKENRRDNDVDVKVSKKIVKEFATVKHYDDLKSKTLCNDCIDWESRMKNVCWFCKGDFSNSRRNYKLNGNMCDECSSLFEDYE